VVPSCWLLTEWLRSWQALGGPWAVFGVSQWQHPAILALAAVGGVWLISFVLVLCNVAIVLLLTSLPRVGAAVLPGASWRWGLAALGVAAGLASVFAGPLAFALTPASPAVRQVTIALVQPGVISNASLAAHASQTLTAELSQGGMLGGVRPDLIVWGESSIGVDLTESKYAATLRQFEALSVADGADLLVNQDTTVPGKGHEKWSVLVSPTGIKGIYVKTRLVPFGEYIPFRQELGWLTKISKAASSNMVPGTGAHDLHVTMPDGQPPLTIGVLICFESAFPDMSRVDTDHGAQLIVYQTSDSTWQASWEWAEAQHAALSALRAAETGRPVVQAALTGDSVAFDARGRLLAWKGPSFRGVALVRLGLPPVSARTLYDRLGDYVPWTAVAIAALAAAVALLRTGRIRSLTGRPRGPADIVWDGTPRRDRSGAVMGTPQQDGATNGSGLEGGSPAAAPRSEQ
jgi:apolipoprotein N-acyltransferase